MRRTAHFFFRTGTQAKAIAILQQVTDPACAISSLFLDDEQVDALDATDITSAVLRRSRNRYDWRVEVVVSYELGPGAVHFAPYPCGDIEPFRWGPGTGSRGAR